MSVWLPVPGWPAYEVSDEGGIRRAVKSRRAPQGFVLKPLRGRSGYLAVNLYRPGVLKTVRIHRIVCTAFHGEPPSPHHEAAHGDGNKINNRADNLRWVTRRENEAEKDSHGTRPKGERHGRAKLTADQVRWARAQIVSGGRPTAIARALGVSSDCICDIRDHVRWAHLT